MLIRINDLPHVSFISHRAIVGWVTDVVNDHGKQDGDPFTSHCIFSHVDRTVQELGPKWCNDHEVREGTRISELAGPQTTELSLNVCDSSRRRLGSNAHHAL